MATSRNRALQGAFVARGKVWMRIVTDGEQKGALVLEGDCVQYRECPLLDKYSLDGILLLV
eukprot:7677838-Lingulodinium_polyedra.AAC.1